MTASALVAAGPRRIPFHVPSIGEEEIAEVVDTLRSGWLTTGPKVKRFEQDFAAYVGARHAVAVNSCTAALHLALEAIGLKPGDEVVIPTYTFTSTGAVVAHLGARPVLADCLPDTANIDAATVAPLITSRTKAIIPVHIAGQACDMEPLLALARKHGLRVVEDAAHAFPATYKGRAVGTLGDLTAFSFYATKCITTGEGGMITTDDADYAARVRTMSLHGLSGDAWNRYSERGQWHYEVLDLGYKYNLTDIAAAMGLHQLRRAEALRARRAEIAAAYSEAFSGLDQCAPPVATVDGAHAWHLYILQLNLPALSCGRDEVVRVLGERGIGTSVHFIPLHLHPAYQRAYGYRPGQFPKAEDVFGRAISLPIYPSMESDDIAQVIGTVQDTLKEMER